MQCIAGGGGLGEYRLRRIYEETWRFARLSERFVMNRAHETRIFQQCVHSGDVSEAGDVKHADQLSLKLSLSRYS